MKVKCLTRLVRWYENHLGYVIKQKEKHIPQLNNLIEVITESLDTVWENTNMWYELIFYLKQIDVHHNILKKVLVLIMDKFVTHRYATSFDLAIELERSKERLVKITELMSIYY